MPHLPHSNWKASWKPALTFTLHLTEKEARILLEMRSTLAYRGGADFDRKLAFLAEDLKGATK